MLSGNIAVTFRLLRICVLYVTSELQRGVTCFILACKFGRLEVAQWLADFCAVDVHAKTPVMIFKLIHDVVLRSIIVSVMVSTTQTGSNAFTEACRNSSMHQTAVLEWLINVKGLNPNHRTRTRDGDVVGTTCAVVIVSCAMKVEKGHNHFAGLYQDIVFNRGLTSRCYPADTMHNSSQCRIIFICVHSP